MVAIAAIPRSRLVTPSVPQFIDGVTSSSAQTSSSRSAIVSRTYGDCGPRGHRPVDPADVVLARHVEPGVVGLGAGPGQQAEVVAVQKALQPPDDGEFQPAQGGLGRQLVQRDGRPGRVPTPSDAPRTAGRRGHRRLAGRWREARRRPVGGGRRTPDGGVEASGAEYDMATQLKSGCAAWRCWGALVTGLRAGCVPHRGGRRHHGDDPLDHLGGRDVVGDGVEAEHEAVRHDVLGDGLDVGGQHVVAAVDQRQCPGRGDQTEGGAGLQPIWITDGQVGHVELGRGTAWPAPVGRCTRRPGCARTRRTPGPAVP